MVKKTFPIGALMEHALPNSNKINEGKIKENTVNLVFYGRKEEKGREINLIYTLNYVIMSPRGGSSSTLLLAEGMQCLVPSRVAGFAFGIVGFSKRNWTKILGHLL